MTPQQEAEIAALVVALKAKSRIQSEFLSSRQCPDHNGKWARGRCLQCENEALRKALQEIKDTEGKVCTDFELCTHEACRSSYAAWAIADSALAARALLAKEGEERHE